MSSIESKLKTFFWYLSKPNYYGQLGSLIKRRLTGSVADNSRHTATEWCQKNSVSTQEALKIITGQSNFPQIEIEFEEEFSNAKQKEKECPVKMGGPGDLNLLYNLCEYIQAKKVIETGVAYGWSSFAILLSLSKRQGLLCSTDMPYPKLNNDKYVGVVLPESLRPYWKLIRLPDDKGLRLALEETGSLDLCHYDSDKSYSGRMFGYQILWNAIRPGGIFISDDINDNLGFHDFCEKNKLLPVIVKVYGKFVGLVIKT